jgi:hypothetical protein
MDVVKPAALQPKGTSSFKKFVRWFLVIILLLAGAFVFWKYYYTYSSGVQGGKMQKISYKGNVFKTWEGYLLISLTTNDNAIALSTKEFLFSVTSDSIAHVLENYEGKRVRVRYNQKNGTLPWRGDTPYIVYEVELDNQ